MYVPERAPGWVFPRDPKVTVPVLYELANENNEILPRPAIVDSLGTKLKIFGSNAGRDKQPKSNTGLRPILSESPPQYIPLHASANEKADMRMPAKKGAWASEETL